MPLAEDIGKAYATYYTHFDQQAGNAAGLLKRMYRNVKRGYRAGKYGYKEDVLLQGFGKLLYLFPLHRSEVDAEARFLRAVPRGRLLDVGCGSGEWLLSMRDLGWRVDGVDLDEDAVRVARRRGLEVRCGTLESQSFPNDSFDAVTLNHVIEHVPRPIQTLAECARILKKGSKLVMFTPNSASFGHSVFRQNWRGLEPPRHLYLFNPCSMRGLLEAAGFSDIAVRTINSSYVWQHSFRLWAQGAERNGRVGARLLFLSMASKMLTLFEHGLLIAWDSSVGECLAVEASKT